MCFTLQDVVPWGRSYDEYIQMFRLTPVDLAGTIAGCGDGPAAFNSHLTRQGGSVISVDPLYQYSRTEIKNRINATFNTVLSQVTANQDDFVWRDIRSPEHLAARRRAAMDTFLADYTDGRKEARYVVGSLPSLDFKDQQFDLALCSHFLFLYSDQLSLDFHLASVAELCRIAGEVRIFPILDLAGKISCYLDTICSHCAANNFTTEVIKVAYEFQKGGNQYLKIYRQ